MTTGPRVHPRNATSLAGLLIGLTLGALAPPGSAGTTFIGSTITEIGPDGRSVTIRTLQGESWSLDVVDPDVIRGVEKGDQVSLEVDAQDRVSKVVKTAPDESPPASGGHRSSDSEY